MGHADTSIGQEPPPARKLRIGLLFQTDRPIRAWECELLGDLAAASFVEIAHVFCARASRSPHTWSPFPLWKLLISIYRAFDHKMLAGSAREVACAFSQVRSMLSHCKWTYLDDSEGESPGTGLEGADLDVILCVHFTDRAVTLCERARAGVWWIGPIGEPDELKGLAHQLDALAQGELMASSVWALRKPAGVAVALESVVARSPSRVSIQKSTMPLRSAQIHLLLSALRKRSLLPAGSELNASACVAESAAQSRVANPYAPHAGRVVGAAAKALRRQIVHRLGKRSPDDLWGVGLRVRSPARSHVDPTDYLWVEAKDGHWWADPFLFQWDNRTWLFFEDIADVFAPASIACAEVDAAGNVGAARVVLKKPYHLSYPQIFTLDGEVFMLPETGTNRTVELYRATHFPDRWELVRTLHQGSFFDTTLSFHEGRLWFFTSLIEDREGLAPQLLLFSSSSIDGDWVLHPDSPISADTRHARGAGNIFVVDGQTIRPAQDGSRTYGGAVRFRRIEKWNEKEFLETSAGLLTPSEGSGVAGIHTYNRSDMFEVIDRKFV